MQTEVQQPHGYEPKSKAFVLDTICRAINHARTWDSVLSRAEALANAMLISSAIECEGFRQDFSAAAAEQKKAFGSGESV
jgi:hypothetical protein